MLSRPTILLIFCVFSFYSFAQQQTNTSIVAEIKTQSFGEFIEAQATIKSKTEIITNVRYVLYVFREDQEEAVNRTEESDNIVIQPNEEVSVKTAIYNINETDKITLMLLLYDDNEKLIGRDRKVVLNSDEEVKKGGEVASSKSEDEIYSGRIRGILTEDTKTKPGRDFYIEFSSIYRLQQMNGVEVVKVYERFSFGRSTIMEVQVGNTVVHRFFTQPRRDFLLEQAKIAIVNVSRYFANVERNQSLIRKY